MNDDISRMLLDIKQKEKDSLMIQNECSSPHLNIEMLNEHNDQYDDIQGPTYKNNNDSQRSIESNRSDDTVLTSLQL